jgi:cytochrome c peroxidase
VGHGWQKGPRNSPTVLNAVFNKAQFWDGRAEDLKAQAKGPIQAGVEMNNLPEQVVITLKSMPEYVERFERSFPGEADPVSFDYMAKAIEAFEVTLVSPNAPFDQRLEGNDAAMTDAQKGCPSCHTGVNLGDQDYFPFGLIKRPGADIPPPEAKGSRAGRRRDGHLAARSHAELRGIGPDRGVSAQHDGARNPGWSIRCSPWKPPRHPSRSSDKPDRRTRRGGARSPIRDEDSDSPDRSAPR